MLDFGNRSFLSLRRVRVALAQWHNTTAGLGLLLACCSRLLSLRLSRSNTTAGLGLSPAYYMAYSTRHTRRGAGPAGDSQAGQLIETCAEAMSKKKSGKREDWEDLDVNADSRLPASHGIIFMINSLVLAAASVCKFFALFPCIIL
jgi:hypothetical protein